ncbi:MAG: hypothetical protein GY868_13015, partial [Deltaproteobacteria bacterium]|nr:hypothetical protein [Deltaproteobacteria bacterium]
MPFPKIRQRPGFFHFPYTYVNAVWGSSGDNVYAVGNLGNIYRYNGRTWFHVYQVTGLSMTVKLHSTNNICQDIWGSSANDIFVVGAEGLILHYNGLFWQKMNSGTDYQLLSVWGSGPDDVYATGIPSVVGVASKGSVFHYDGEQWSEIYSSEDTYFRKVRGISAEDVFVLTGQGELLQYDGTSWLDITPDGGHSINDIWGDSQQNIFLAGTQPLHFNGRHWREMDSDFHMWLMSVWGCGGTGVYAAGNRSKLLDYQGGIFKYNPDIDADGITNDRDNCPDLLNPDQRNSDTDLLGDLCDNCPAAANDNQTDTDLDGLGDVCDPYPVDPDNDTFDDAVDNCPIVYNPDQADRDGDGFGDVCDLGDRFAVADSREMKVFIYDMEGRLVTSVDVRPYGQPLLVRDAGSSGWFVKVYGGSDYYDWAICHIDSSGAIRGVYDVSTPGVYFSGLTNGSFVTGTMNGTLTLYDAGGNELSISDAWHEPQGRDYDYTLMGDVAGLVDGRFVLVPEIGTQSLCTYGSVNGNGYTPYLYFYDEQLTLQRMVDISAHRILLIVVNGLPDGGFVATGNTDGSGHATHLFRFDANGTLVEQRDITVDIP